MARPTAMCAFDFAIFITSTAAKTSFVEFSVISPPDMAETRAATANTVARRPLPIRTPSKV